MVYETPLFKYVVEQDSRYDLSRDVAGNHEWLEQMAKRFESFTQYGAGAYAHQDWDGLTWIDDKPTIEYLSSNQGISWGGVQGAELSLWDEGQEQQHRGYGGRVSWVERYSYLTLHEYGHHETMMDAILLTPDAYGRIGFNNGVGRLDQSFDAFKNQLSVIGHDDLLKYWGGNAMIGSNPFGSTTELYHTPFGDIAQAHSIYNEPNYNWRASEWLTRVQGVISSNYPSDYYNDGWMGLTSDIGGMAQWFPNHVTPFDAGNIDDVIAAYKRYIYGIGNPDGMELMPQGEHLGDRDFSRFYGIATNKDESIKSITYRMTLNGWNHAGRSSHYIDFEQQFGQHKDAYELVFGERDNYHMTDGHYDITVPVDFKPVQYRFNNDFTNEVPEEIINGYLMQVNLTDAQIEKIEAFKELSAAAGTNHIQFSVIKNRF